MESDYSKYRGKCKEYCEELVKQRKDLKIVRGHYYDPIWNKNEEHWWCVDVNGCIIDPTKKQFPTCGAGTYTEFNGMVNCEQCDKEMKEEECYMMGRYPVCSDGPCARLLVGL